jgi:hypothetical protein
MFYWNRLNPKEQSIIRRHLKRGLNFLAPTMCPANKDAKTGELESFSWVIGYYKNLGLDYLVLQPKFMGSRVQLYLYKDTEKPCIAYTRSGFPIRNPDIQPLLETWRNRVFAKFPAAKFVILDGELLPWSFFAKDLVSKDFDSIYAGNLAELQALRETGFGAKYLGSWRFASNFATEFSELLEAEKSGRYTRKQLSKFKEPLIKKFGHFQYKNIKTFLETSNLDVLLRSSKVLYGRLQRYKKQIDLYAADYPIKFEPFQILKVDGQVLPYSNHEGFTFFSNRPCKLIDLNSDKDCKDAEILYHTWLSHPEWFGDCCALEGVVIKPLSSKHFSPGFKVRNSEYLRLVYGPYYDLPTTYQTIFDKKWIQKKLKLSIREHQLGLKMLSFSQDQIQTEGAELANDNIHEQMQVLPTIIDFYRAECQLRFVDPRL